MPNLMPVRILHGAFMGSIVMYGIVLWLVQTQHLMSTTFPPDLAILKVALAGVWLMAIFILSRVVEPNMVRGIKSSDNLVTKYQSVVIIRAAFYESGAIYGLVLGLLGAPFQLFLMYAGAAFLLMVLKFPSDDNFQQFKDAIGG